MKTLLIPSIVAILAAAPALAQTPPAAAPAKPINQRDLRHHIYVMEGALARAVDYGAKELNREILQVMADVFGADVDRLATGNSAALGAALRAFHAIESVRTPELRWDDVVAEFTRPVPGARVSARVEYRELYDRLIVRYFDCERRALS